LSKTVQVQVAEAPVLMAWQFKYLGGFVAHSFETMPFYKETLRGFLRQNLGKIVWLKGALIEQPAYLVFYKELAQEVYDILLQPLQDGGRFGVIPLKNPIPIIRKYSSQTRLCLGYLDLKQNGKLGSVSSVLTPTNIDYLNGFWLNKNVFIKADDAYEKQHEGETWVCFLDAIEMQCSRDGKIAFTVTHRELWLHKKDAWRRFNG